MVAYGRSFRRVRLERQGQLLFRVDGRCIDPEARTPALRAAALEEIDWVMKADRAMVLEELGFNPFVNDARSYNEGWRRRIREERAWVIGRPGTTLDFKLEQSAVSDTAAQISGVYTRPEIRRRGVAARAVGEMCHRLLREVALVTLYVDCKNKPAVRLYEGLGFERVGRIRTVWWEPH